MKRRTASGLLVVTGSALVAGTVGLPVLIAACSPLWQAKKNHWRKLGLLRDFPIGQVTTAAIAAERTTWPRAACDRPVFVWRTSEQETVVYSRSCTDLGCPLDYEPGSGCFLCPCHGGIFAQDGRHLAGPPRSPMLRYSSRVENGVLEVDVASLPPAS